MSQENKEQHEGASDAAAENVNQEEQPIYARLGFEDENSFIEDYQTKVARIQELEPEMETLRSKPAEYKIGFLKDVEDYTLAEIETGVPEHEAYEKAISVFSSIAKPWNEVAKKSPLDVLVEREARKYPEIARSMHEEIIKSQFGLDSIEPDKDEYPDEHAKWERIQNTAMAKMQKDAIDAAKELEAQKAGLKIHPSIAASREQMMKMQEVTEKVRPEFHKTLNEVSSSLTEIQFGDFKFPVKVKPEMVSQLGSYDPKAFVDDQGRVDADKVRTYVQRGLILEGIEAIVSEAIKYGRSKATEEDVNRQRNPGESGQRRANTGAGEMSEAARAYHSV